MQLSIATFYMRLTFNMSPKIRYTKAMDKFEQAYKNLNPEQRDAVDYIDGPLLVIAGPGTGKTQLLSVRIANILKNRDISPENILCLTFTDVGAMNMRQRLETFIGPAANRMPIYTYHAFGSTILKDNLPDQSEAIDDLEQRQIIRHIQKNLIPPNDILRGDQYCGTITDLIKQFKGAELSPDDLEYIANDNQKRLDQLNQVAAPILNSLEPRTSLKKSLPKYEELANSIRPLIQTQNIIRDVEPITNVIFRDLMQAIESCRTENSVTPFTTKGSGWRASYCRIDSSNYWRFDNTVALKKLRSIANIMRLYDQELEARHSFDYSDMILKAINLLQTDQALRYNLQERFQYILLDEYQDTNGAQAKLVELIANNGINPANIMAVGDDDQAIYGFQGASNSNFLDFDQIYHPKHIFLNKNYRSSAAILELAHNIIEQGTDRFSKSPAVNIDKKILAQNAPDTTDIKYCEYKSPAAEYADISDRILALLESGVPANKISVIAPQHQQLLAILPFLKRNKIPISYKKRDNILESPEISQILCTIDFLLALNQGKFARADSFLPRILSFKQFKISSLEVVHIIKGAKAKQTTILEYLLESPDDKLRSLAENLFKLSQQLDDYSSEYIINGILNLQFSDEERYSILTNLSILRDLAKNRQKQNKLMLKDFRALIEAYITEEIPILNQSPYYEADLNILVTTIHAAKGLEFDYVFLLDVEEKFWGNTGNKHRNAMPHNLRFISHKGDSSDDKLRLLFVAITRARSHLFMGRSNSDLSATKSQRLSFLNYQEDADGHLHSPVIPAPFQDIYTLENEALSLEDLEDNWFDAYLDKNIFDAAILKDRLDKLKLTASMAINFIDLTYHDHKSFIREQLYGWPSDSANIHTIYGSCIHLAMQKFTEQQLTNEQTVAAFVDAVSSQDIDQSERDEILRRGRCELANYLEQRGEDLRNPKLKVKAEYSFYNEHIKMDDVLMSGKIDRIEIDEASRSICVVDFKTGKPKDKWTTSNFTYELQLYFYKFFIENSPHFRGYKVDSGRIEYIPANDYGDVKPLALNFQVKRATEFKRLFAAIFHHIKTLNFPDTSDFKSTKNFVDFLIQSEQKN